MTTETPDDRPPTDPRVIDLEAEEIRTAAAAVRLPMA